MGTGSRFLGAISITLFISTLTCVVSILVMIHGWGLEPKSWGWIIGGYIVIYLLGSILGFITALLGD